MKICAAFLALGMLMLTSCPAPSARGGVVGTFSGTINQVSTLLNSGPFKPGDPAVGSFQFDVPNDGTPSITIIFHEIATFGDYTVHSFSDDLLPAPALAFIADDPPRDEVTFVSPIDSRSLPMVTAPVYGDPDHPVQYYRPVQFYMVLVDPTGTALQGRDRAQFLDPAFWSRFAQVDAILEFDTANLNPQRVIARIDRLNVVTDSATVPEPSTLALMTIGALALLRRGSRSGGR